MSADIKGNIEIVDEAKSFEVADEFKVSAWGVRHQQSIILFFTLTIAYSMRACMGVALVAMTHQHFNLLNHTVDIANSSEHDSANENRTLINSTKDEFEMQGFLNGLMLTPPYPSFKWSKSVQDTVISSFFWGYMSLQIPAGQLAHRFGAKYLLTAAMIINCVISAFLPLAAYYGGWICLVICRVLQGVSQACILPSMHTFFGKWAPLKERGRLTSLTYGGQALGTVLGLPITGFISSTSMGWPGLFRFYALLSGAIGGIVWWLATDTPSKHANITVGERKYIEDGLGQKAGYDKRQLAVPWSRILRSTGVYAIIIAHCGNTWGQLILYAEVPAFMDKVIGVNIKAVGRQLLLVLCVSLVSIIQHYLLFYYLQDREDRALRNGLLTALPFMVMWCTNFFFSWLTDMLIVRKTMSVTNVRKFANSLGCLPAAIGLVVLAYVPKNIYVVESILVIICSFKISAHMGFQVNHIDISPNFAGTLMSLSNFVSNAVASLAPIITSIILTDVKSEYLWRQVFFVAAGLYFFTNLFYCIFGTAETAEWNDSGYDNSSKEARLEENDSMLDVNNH